MPVNGIGSPSRVSGPGTTSTPSPTTPTATVQPTPNTGWSAGSGTRGVVDPTLRPTVSAADVQATLPNPVRAALEQSLSTFTSRVETALGHDAMSIARGRTPVREGDALTDAQQQELQDAATDLLRDLPLGALDPGLAASVQERLSAAGIDTRDVASTRLGDLGKIGGDIARDLIKDLKRDSPTAYYSVAAGLAAAIGAVGYTQGSAKLASLGVKPEVKTKLFDDQLEVKLRGNWDAHFKNFNATATVTGRLDLGSAGRLAASVSANSATGFESGRVQYDFDRPNLNLSAYGTVNRNGLESLGGTVEYRPSDNLRLSGTVDHNFQTNRTTATGEVAYRVRDNVDFALSASHDSRGDSRVGAGVRIRF